MESNREHIGKPKTVYIGAVATHGGDGNNNSESGTSFSSSTAGLYRKLLQCFKNITGCGFQPKGFSLDKHSRYLSQPVGDTKCTITVQNHSKTPKDGSFNVGTTQTSNTHLLLTCGARWLSVWMRCCMERGGEEGLGTWPTCHQGH